MKFKIAMALALATALSAQAQYPFTPGYGENSWFEMKTQGSGKAYEPRKDKHPPEEYNYSPTYKVFYLDTVDNWINPEGDCTDGSASASGYDKLESRAWVTASLVHILASSSSSGTAVGDDTLKSGASHKSGGEIKDGYGAYSCPEYIIATGNKDLKLCTSSMLELVVRVAPDTGISSCEARGQGPGVGTHELWGYAVPGYKVHYVKWAYYDKEEDLISDEDMGFDDPAESFVLGYGLGAVQGDEEISFAHTFKAVAQAASYTDGYGDGILASDGNVARAQSNTKVYDFK